MEQKFWALPLGLVLLKIDGFCLGFAGEMSFEMGGPHCPRMFNIQIKTLFLSHQSLSLEIAFW